MSDKQETLSDMLTIKMINAPSVLIDTRQWPVIARGQHHDWDGEFEFQSNRDWKVTITVRRHSDDGRCLVYGTAVYSTSWQNERNLHQQCGVLIENDSEVVDFIESEYIVGEIRHVEAFLNSRLPAAAIARTQEAADLCIADLPPVRL